MAERLNAPVLKTGVSERAPRVRIPLSPHLQKRTASRPFFFVNTLEFGCNNSSNPPDLLTSLASDL